MTIPSRPYPEFPLYAHSAGYWAKCIKGKTYYFGKWADPEGALAKYSGLKEAIASGTLLPKIRTIRDAVNAWVSHKQVACKDGSLASGTLREYKKIGDRIVDCIGATVELDSINESHLSKLCSHFEDGYSPKTSQNSIRKSRLLFNWLQSSGRWSVNKHREAMHHLRIASALKRSSKNRARVANESRGVAILSQDLGREVARWSSKIAVFKEMSTVHSGGGVDDLVRSNEMNNCWTNISPDAYFIQEQIGPTILDWNDEQYHLCLVEVENTSPMTEDKVQRYGLIWHLFTMSECWRLHLIVVDRYDQWREMDLRKFYLRATSGKPHQEGSVAC